jgi:CubicO group peptidase (beta-lactamase class C family)
MLGREATADAVNWGCLVRHLALVLTLAVTAAGLPKADGSDRTEWLVDPTHKARIASIAAELVAEIPGDPAGVRMPLQRWMELYRIPGLSLAVFDADRLLWAKTFGVREAGRPDPVTIDTLFQAGSISKPVTAMAALHFVERGRWSLDEDINARLVSWKVPFNDLQKEQKVTLRRLLSHNAGTTVHGFPGYAIHEPVPTVVQVLDGAPPANTGAVRVDLVPGTRVRYSGGGTTIVQLMMTDQLGKPFPEIMQETVLGPLGMAQSSFEQPLPPARAAMTAAGTRSGGQVVQGRWHVYPEMAAAGLWTTPSDLAKLAIEVSKANAGASSTVLSQAMTRQMLTVQAGEFGIGFALAPEEHLFGHNGADEGFQALLRAFTDSGRGVVIMANSDNGFAIFDRLAHSIGRAYGWKGFDPDPDQPGTTADLLMRLRGVDASLDWYREARRQDPGRFRPGDLNRLGYQLLRSERAAEAIKVFEANVTLYPDDANAYDSLGEGYMVAGNKAAAITNYRKSLAMDPSNENAKKMLSKLEGK